MISCREAQRLIGRYPVQFGSERVALACARGRILVQDILADRDGPPFHRVAMDGIAVASKVYGQGQREFTCEGLQAAGAPITQLKSPLACIESMTGAVLPIGCDAVIPFEKCEKQGDHYLAKEMIVEPWANVHRCASDFKKGQNILTTGVMLRSPECGVLASLGYTDVSVRRGPKIAIITTGSELVEVSDRPLTHQIRKSNVFAAQWALQQRGFCDVRLHHLNDQLQETEERLNEWLNTCDILIVSGGVSKGKLDFVPQALENIQVHKVFHHIAQKPGKPMWFGHRHHHLVFALPGNPVSMLICLERYVIPHLEACRGQLPSCWSLPSLDLAKARPELTQFKTAKICSLPSGCSGVQILKDHGSGDFASLCGGDGFIEIPPATQDYPAGTHFRYFPWS